MPSNSNQPLLGEKITAASSIRAGEQFTVRVGSGRTSTVTIEADDTHTTLHRRVLRGILDLLRRLNRERNLATILITHDLGVVAEIADRVLVMYGGKVVEQGTLEQIFYDPQHPYAWGLLGSLTRLDTYDRPEQALRMIESEPAAQVLEPWSIEVWRASCRAMLDRAPSAIEAAADVSVNSTGSATRHGTAPSAGSISTPIRRACCSSSARTASVG